MRVEANENFTAAIMLFRDNTTLCFCHRVGERWAKAVGSVQPENETGLAEKLLSAVILLRLNAKHLDIQFDDVSRWDEALQEFKRDG